MNDRILGGLGLLLSAFYIWRATVIELPFISDPVGPKVFPIIIAVMFGLASLVIILRPEPSPKWPALPRLLELLAALVVLIGYAELLPELGFVVATVFAAAFLSWRLGATPVQAAAAGLGISFGIYAVFHLILGLSLARGPLGI